MVGKINDMKFLPLENYVGDQSLALVNPNQINTKA